MFNPNMVIDQSRLKFHDQTSSATTSLSPAHFLCKKNSFRDPKKHVDHRRGRTCKSPDSALT